MQPQGACTLPFMQGQAWLLFMTVAAGDLPDNTLHHLRFAVLVKPVSPYAIKAAGQDSTAAEYQPYTISPGQAKGVLTGGNLSLLTAMIGTAFEPTFRRKIVFIEDVGEQPYRLDRMLTPNATGDGFV